MRRLPTVVAAGVLSCAAFLSAAAVASAEQAPPANLGNGLARLVEPAPPKPGIRLTQAPLAIRDPQGRVLVDVYAEEGTSLPSVRQEAESAGFDTVAQSREDKTLEGFVAVDDIAALATASGVASVSQALKPYTKVGAATSQGVRAHRADRVPAGIDGSGVTVGALSDSFDTATETTDGAPLTVHAADDIRTGDLPADGVTVLEDAPGGADEGRAMLQIVHDMAPGARQCFATAFTGEVQFADNIRALADPQGPCGADVIVDDVGYFDEPFFGRGPIGDAIDEVAAQGVHYFSAAGNGSSQQAHQAPLRLVSPTDPLDVANLDLAGIDPELYAGGFQDFDPGPGVDTAQDLLLGADPTSSDGGADGVLDLQWDDPVDPTGAPLGDPLIDTTGEITAAQPVASIPFPGKAGQTVHALVDAIPSGSTDFILTLKDPNGTVLRSIDTGTSPELLVATLPVTGTYTFEVSGFQGDVGDFTFTVRPVLGTSHTTTDLNVLFFDRAGNFLFALGDLNRISGKPLEIGGLHGRGGYQLAIAKASAEPGAATQLRYQMIGGLQYAEYVQPSAPSIYGHPLAHGATAVAAYGPFRPLLPEDYTSVGGDLPILFDSAGNRLPEPDVRRAPQIAATDGGNTTFFSRDSALDSDEQPNFFGTSAAAPHAAAIAALVLQASGGPGSTAPDAMRARLQASTFRHDLDVQHSGASREGLTITADGPLGAERRESRPEWTTPGSMNGTEFFKVRFDGPGSIVSLTFDGIGANPTGRGSGLVFDPRPFAGPPALDNPLLWQQGFPFTVDRGSQVAAADVAATFSVPGVGDANDEQFERMTLAVTPGALGDGRTLVFGVDRDEAVTAYGVAQEGNSADQLGQGVLIPSGRVVGPGLAFEAQTSTGATIVGHVRNRIGAGWTPVDGFGFVNAQRAVGGGVVNARRSIRGGSVKARRAARRNAAAQRATRARASRGRSSSA